MKLTCGLKILGCIAFSLLSATAGLGAAAGTLAEADALLNSPTLSMSQAARALSLYEGAAVDGRGAPGVGPGAPGPDLLRSGPIGPQAAKLWDTTSRGSPTPRP